MDKHERAAALVACPEWEWARGMVSVDGEVVISVDGSGVRLPCGSDTYWIPFRSMPAPDYDDPATTGCIVALAERKFGVLIDVDALADKSGRYSAIAFHSDGAYTVHDGWVPRGEAVADLFLGLSQARKEGRL